MSMSRRTERRRRPSSQNTRRTRQPPVLTQLRRAGTRLQKTCVYYPTSGRTEVCWTLEPGGKLIDSHRARAAIESGRLVVADRGLPLFDDDQHDAQSWIFNCNAMETTMDVRKYLKSQRPKYDELVDNPLRGNVVAVKDGEKFDKPDMTIAVGGVTYVLGLNTGNLSRLAAAWGWDTANWTGRIVKLEAGEASFGGGKIESIIATPISPPIKAEERATAAPAPSHDKPIDDEIPF